MQFERFIENLTKVALWVKCSERMTKMKMVGVLCAHKHPSVCCCHRLCLMCFIVEFHGNFLYKLQIGFYEQWEHLWQKANNLFVWLLFFCFPILLHCLFEIDEIGCAQRRIVWQNGKRTHTLGQTERKKIEKKEEHVHGCAQVYVNAHLYCTKIRWNELLMKLKYMPMKSRCQRAQDPSLWQSSEMKSSCC